MGCGLVARQATRWMIAGEMSIQAKGTSAGFEPNMSLDCENFLTAQVSTLLPLVKSSVHF
jgi:hypothetical protein